MTPVAIAHEITTATVNRTEVRIGTELHLSEGWVPIPMLTRLPPEVAANSRSSGSRSYGSGTTGRVAKTSASGPS
jgi:hypothetical protein